VIRPIGPIGQISRILRKKFYFFLFIFFGLAAGIASQWPDGRMRVVLCDVGQGDGILLTQGFTQVLVDGGPNSRVVDCLSGNMPFWDRKVEVVIATHPDKDHITGLADVIENYNVISFVSINRANKTAEFEELRKAVLQGRTPVHIAKTGDKVVVGKIKLDILWPEENKSEQLVWVREKNEQVLGESSGDSSSNDFSVVAKASFGKFDVLLTGDISKSIEEKLVERFDLSGIEVLKVAHHGSKYSTSKELLEEVRPKVALIGVGKNNWGHPDGEVLGELGKLGVKILRTDTMGEMEVVSDGDRFWEK